VDGAEDMDHIPGFADWRGGNLNGSISNESLPAPLYNATTDGWWPADYERVDARKVAFVSIPGGVIAVRDATTQAIVMPSPLPEQRGEARLSIGAIVGITFGATAFVVLVVVAIYFRGSIAAALASEPSAEDRKAALAATRAGDGSNIKATDGHFKGENPLKVLGRTLPATAASASGPRKTARPGR